MITKTTSLNELIEEACGAAEQHVQPGEYFIVRDLFRGIEWNRIEPNNRKQLGLRFLAYVNSAGASMFEPFSKTSQHQQIYVRK